MHHASTLPTRPNLHRGLHSGTARARFVARLALVGLSVAFVSLGCGALGPAGPMPGAGGVTPGAPGCEVGGEAYALGESFPSADGCNTCICEEGGGVACTERACPPPEPTECEACLASGGTWQPPACTTDCALQDTSCFRESCPKPCSSDGCQCFSRSACESAGCQWNSVAEAQWCTAR